MRRPATKTKPAPTRSSLTAVARPGLPVWLMAVMLALVTIALYWPATGHDFVNLDDNQYVLENTHVTGGLTWENARWAFGSGYAGNWHPVTWLSHMVDCQMFGLKPWGHHLTSVLLHALNALLVFGLLQQMTDAKWRSLLAAALFAVHPLHVESVVWVAERKDVLSGFFGLLALIFYARYALGRRRSAEGGARKPATPGTPPAPRIAAGPGTFYLLSLLFFALGLMSKPMLVTWPVVMLLLDYWPLRRFEPSTRNSRLSTLWRLVAEKVPFFVLAALASVVTFVVQQRGGSVIAVEVLPLGVRGANALVSYCRYLGKLFWPTELAAFYPHPGHWPPAKVVLAGGLMLGISALLFVRRRRSPFLLMGWLWFCSTLVPVIGLVQVGGQAMADRYTYIPSMGMVVVAVWGAYELTGGWRYPVVVRSVVGSAVIGLCLALTWRQLGYWKNTEVLFRHALAVTQGNYLAHKAMGDVLSADGNIDEAFSQYAEAIRLKPSYAEAHNNLANALEKKGQLDERISHYEEAIRLKPDYAEPHYNLANILRQKGRIDEAISQYEQAVRLNPDDVEARNNFGAALDMKGRSDEAIRQYQEAIRLKPGDAGLYDNLGNALDKLGRTDQAIPQYQAAIRLKPDYANLHNDLGVALVRKGQVNEAISQYREAIRLKPDYALARNNLGVALERNGQVGEAISQYQEALRLIPDYADARNNLARALEMKNSPANR